MQRDIFLILLLVYGITDSYSQEVTERVSNSVGVVFVNHNNTQIPKSTGTATLLIKNITSTSAKMFLVTCKHVLPKPTDNDSIVFKFKNAGPDKSTPSWAIAIPIYDVAGKYQPYVKDDPDGNDLCLIEITPIFAYNYKQLSYFAGNEINATMLVSKEISTKEAIGIGDEVYFVGFPSYLYDQRNYSPILRKGIIATSPAEDFYFNDLFLNQTLKKYNSSILKSKLSGFLIDANVFNGSSGSLVFLKPEMTRYNPQTGFNTNPDFIRRVEVLGIISESYFNASGNLVEHIQIGSVISAGQIIKTLELFK